MLVRTTRSQNTVLADQTPDQTVSQAASSPVRSGSKALWLNDFKRDESGVLVIFSLFFILIILMVGGLGVDLMRTEMTRTRLQHAADNAALAAADLDQTLSPEGVVIDYFSKAGMSEYLDGVTVDEGIGYRIVDVDVSTSVTTQFIHMVGVDSLPIVATSTAEESIDGVEISMVLDISGSMGSNSRLTNLRSAAKDFIDTVMDSSEDGKVSISIVPYATQVAAGADLLAQYNVTSEHDYSHCVDFSASDFNSISLSTSTQLERTGHFDPWSYSEYEIDSPVCNLDAASQISVLSKNRDALKTQIDGLIAKGNTSIDVGMKWGTTLLDPGTKPVITNLIAQGAVHSDFSARPSSYSDSATLKVIVVMTDGQNTSQYYLEDEYRDGNSDVWYNPSEDVYSIYYANHSGSNDYYWPHKGNWYDHAYGNGTTTSQDCDWRHYYYGWRWVCTNTTVDEPGTADRLTFPELWNQTSIPWNQYYNYRPFMGNSSSKNFIRYPVYDSIGGSTKDTRLHNICEAAKNNGIVVYTIGFEAPSGGRTVLKDCASSDSHYYDVDGIEISEAFAAIASSIRKLKLTK